MSKLIIDNCSTESDEFAIGLVLRVLAEGKVSTTGTQKHHAHISVFNLKGTGPGYKVAVYCHPNYKSEKFTVDNYRGN